MKIAFIIQFNKPEFGGMYFSSTSRIKHFIESNRDFDVRTYNIRPKPGFLIRIIRRLIKGSNFYPQTSVFNGLVVNNIYFSVSFYELVKSNIKRQYLPNYSTLIKEIIPYFEDVNLIAAHFGYGPGEIALYLSSCLGEKFTVTYHGSDINLVPFLNKHYFELCKKMLMKSSANIFVSRALQEKSFEIFPSLKNSFVLYSGFDFKNFKRSDIESIDHLKKELRLNNRVVGFVGGLVDVKNVLRLPDIFKNTSEYEKSISFLLIGEGNLKEQLEKSLKENNLDVVFLGSISNDEMPKYYSLMDVLVLPSRHEGLPRVIIEALACGVNCVGSKVGGIPELLPHENTFELNSNFEKSIANRIVELLNSRPTPVIDKSLFNFELTALKQGEIYRKILVHE